MARPVICPSCGNQQELPDDYVRRKVRCPQCGVMCPVEAPVAGTGRAAPAKPAAPPPAAAEADVEELARQLWSEPDEPAAGPLGKTAPTPEPKAKRAAPSQPEVASTQAPQPKRVTWDKEDEDDSPYDLAGGPIRSCPECHREMERSAVVCVGCGYDLRKKTKTTKVYEPIERNWHTGLPFAKRLKLFALAVAGGLVPVVFGAVVTQKWVAFGVSWLAYSGMMAFLIGTFDRLHLVRDPRGRLTLTKTWTACFFDRLPQEIDLTPYGELVTGRSRDAGIFEWFILVTLLGYFLVPGIIWYRKVIAATQFQVALARDHGSAEIILYRGSDERLMRDIATTLRDAARLRLDG